MTTATATRERPILFSGPMVRAILDGTKTQTRRVMLPQPPEDAGRLGVGAFHPTIVVRGEEEPGDETFGAWTDDGEWAARCPFGQPGDRLWVRETWGLATGKYGNRWRPGTVLYRADVGILPDGTGGIGGSEIDLMRWKPSIFMRREHSRITLELTGVRVERLQAITAEGAIAEGIPSRGIEPPCIASAIMYLHDFEQLWNSINASRGYGWDVNPWVWVLEFQKVSA